MENNLPITERCYQFAGMLVHLSLCSPRESCSPPPKHRSWLQPVSTHRGDTKRKASGRHCRPSAYSSTSQSCRQWDKHQQVLQDLHRLIYLSLSTAFHYTKYTLCARQCIRVPRERGKCRCDAKAASTFLMQGKGSHDSSSQLILSRLRLTQPSQLNALTGLNRGRR